MGDLNKGLKSFFEVNRKLHIYLGLFIFLFIWLFFVSGLIMNHSKWKVRDFYEKRIEEKTDFNVPDSIVKGNPDAINTIRSYLNISGEVSNVSVKEENIGFRISSPGIIQEVNFDTTGKGSLKVMKYNFWGKLYTLHLFNGMNKNDPEKRPNWIIAKIWRTVMDITAIILIILSLGSWIMWYKVRREYTLGYIFLAAGIIIAGYYLFLIDIV